MFFRRTIPAVALALVALAAAAPTAGASELQARIKSAARKLQNTIQ